jgi:putative membrane protein
MIAIRDLPHVLAVINAATIVVLLRAYSLIRARDREGHRRTMFVAIGLGVAFLMVYLVYHAFAGLAKFGGYGPIRPIYFYNALKQRFAIHKRLARVTLPAWLFVAVSGLVVYVMAVHLYPMPAS